MPLQRKKIKYEYYGVYFLEYDKSENTLVPKKDNLESFFEDISKLKVTERKYKYKEESVRIQEIKKEGQYWLMHIVKIRDGYLPGKGNEAGTFDILKLAEDEWLGEGITVLYDSKKGVMMIQRNRNGLNVSGVQEFFNYLLSDSTSILYLRPKYSFGNALESNSKCTKIGITVDMSKLNGEPIKEYKWLTSLLTSADTFHGSKVTISITNGGRRKEEYNLNSEEILRLPGLSKIDGVEKLEIGLKQDSDSRVEMLDLLDNKLCDYDTLDYSRNYPINHERIKNSMIAKYNKRLLIEKEM